MNILDSINGAFQLGSSVAIFDHCWTAYKNKSAASTSKLAVGFFTLWSVWNIIYFVALDQYFSVLCGTLAVIANFCYMWLLHLYTEK